MLITKGTKIFDNGIEIQLKGINIGSWMMMENFMSGFAGAEKQFRKYFLEQAGEEKYHAFFDAYMQSFFTEEDAAYLHGIGMNIIRIPLNWRYFQQAEYPYESLTIGFELLKPVVEWCRKYRIYILLDLHAAPGCQNRDWHSDNARGESFLFKDKECQDRTVAIWKHIASYYRDEEVIGGYDLLNEPDSENAEEARTLDELYVRIADAVRQVDPKHMLVISGDHMGRQFDFLRAPFDDNMMYNVHQYTLASLHHAPYPKYDQDDMYDKETLRLQLEMRIRHAKKYQIPVIVSEFGVIDDQELYHPYKLRIMKDQLNLFEDFGCNWTLWGYKDVGSMGLLRIKENTPWFKMTKDLIRLKHKYKCDFDPVISETWQLTGLMKEYIGDDFGEYYEEAKTAWEKQLPLIFNETLAKKFAKQLAGKTSEELKEAGRSFSFSNCDLMKEWEEILKENLYTGRN